MSVGGLLVACMLAACGSASSSNAPSNPLAAALSYMPSGSPVLATVAATANAVCDDGGCARHRGGARYWPTAEHAGSADSASA